MKNRMTRRRFVGSFGGALAATGIGGILPAIAAGRGRRGRNDLLIRGGTVVDGSGGEPRLADVAISGGRIRRIGNRLAEEGAEVIDARGLVVAPGFIDAHSHTAYELLADSRAESQVRQGVTSEVCGNCGSSGFPLAAATYEEDRAYMRQEFGIELDWRDIGGYFARLRAAGHAVNHATLLGHGNLRADVVGLADRPATAAEMRRMRAQVAADMRAGALGLSAGLEYAPGCFAQATELAELCRPLARAGGVFALHMRNEGERLLESIAEAVGIARSAGVRLQVSHFKTAYPANWGKLDAAFAALEEAARSGLRLAADRYPYIAGATDLSFFFPTWAREGSSADFISRLKDSGAEGRLRAHLAEAESRLGSWERVRITSVVGEANKSCEGRSILACAAARGQSPYDFMRELLVAEKNRVGIVIFNMSEDNLKRILAHPLVMIGADGSATATDGILARGRPHPRLFGTFARVLARYVREERVLTLAQAIRKMTAMPAAQFGLAGRGQLREGGCADIVLFDPDRVRDEATFDDPARYPSGIPHVLVNGVPVIRGGEHTGAKPGKILRIQR